MQLLGRDSKGRLVEATEASRAQSYQCMECGGTIRIRGGKKRQLHFYHLQRTQQCRQAGKSLLHLQIQLRLQNLISTEAHLEHAFESIGRIADVYWKSAGIVFEVQCSHISDEEIKARNTDYATLGLTVIWIMHPRWFKKWNKTHWFKVEAAGHLYYTDIDSRGLGSIYDQLHARSPRLLIDPTRVATIPTLPKNAWHPAILERVRRTSLCIQGDALDQCRIEPTPPYLLKDRTSWKRRITTAWVKCRELLHGALDEFILRLE